MGEMSLPPRSSAPTRPTARASSKSDRLPSLSARIAAGVVTALSVLALASPMLTTSCSAREGAACDHYVTRCRTVCNTWCDDYGCYPDCYDQCWDDCTIDVSPPPPVSSDDAAPPTPLPDGAPAANDAAVPPPRNDGGGVLCSACQSNADCSAGGLCILQGGNSARGGFCGQACMGTSASSDCPAGYTCSAIGASRQCVPSSGACP